LNVLTPNATSRDWTAVAFGIYHSSRMTFIMANLNHTHYIKLACQNEELPSRYSTRSLTMLTRKLIKTYQRKLDDLTTILLSNAPLPITSKTSSSRRDLGEEEHTHYMLILRSYLAQELDFWHAQNLHKDILSGRIELLRTLSVSTRSSHDRRAQAVEQVLEQVDLFSGWRRLLIDGDRFQLGDPEPWWRPGEFLQNEIDRENFLKKGIKDIEKAGFFRVSREQYLSRVRTSIIRTLTSSSEYMLGPASLITLYTIARQERSEIAHRTRQLQSLLFSRTHVELREHSTPVPLQPLYSLPREMRNLGSFFVSAPDLEKLPVDSTETRMVHPESGASSKLHEQQSLLFYDKSLVSRQSQRPDQFIEVQLDAQAPTVLDALIQAMENFQIEESTFVHLPRIAAGFFNAAMRDRTHNFSTEGTFWDTQSGKRLCQIIGFNPDNKRHRKRVQDARAILERVILHREIVEIKDDGKSYRKVAWRGPLIEPRKEELSVEIGTSEGITAHSTLQSWQIAGALWNMVKPRLEGGAPSFMALDERAFELDESDSIPFNVYWTLINRSYISKLDRSGSVEISVDTFYKWSGLEGKHQRTNRLRKTLADIFDRMVDLGLLSAWSSDVFDSDRSMAFQSFLDGKVKLTFSYSHLRTLEHLLPEDHDLLMEPYPKGALSSSTDTSLEGSTLAEESTSLEEESLGSEDDEHDSLFDVLEPFEPDL